MTRSSTHNPRVTRANSNQLTKNVRHSITRHLGVKSTNPALGHVRLILTNFVAFREVPVEREGWGRLRSTACAGTTSTSTWLPPSEISTSDM